MDVVDSHAELLSAEPQPPAPKRRGAEPPSGERSSEELRSQKLKRLSPALPRLLGPEVVNDVPLVVLVGVQAHRRAAIVVLPWDRAGPNMVEPNAQRHDADDRQALPPPGHCWHH